MSNSWDGPEFSTETSYDSYFAKAGVAFFVSTGDSAFAVEYPAVSPNVVAVGGTSLSRNPTTGDFEGETYWDNASGGGGGGLSEYESRPSFQSSIQNIVGSKRGVPDLSSDADPVSGVAVYDSFPYEGYAEGWIQLGGTSVSAPTMAGRANAVGIVSSTLVLQDNNYGEYAGGTAYPNNFRDITSGASECVPGWDFCSGIGSPLGPQGASGGATATPTNSSSYTTYGVPPTIEFTETLYDSTPGAQIYWQVNSCSGSAWGSDPISSGDSFGLEYQSQFDCNPSGTMYATAPGHSQSATVPIYF